MKRKEMKGKEKKKKKRKRREKKGGKSFIIRSLIPTLKELRFTTLKWNHKPKICHPVFYSFYKV